MAEIRSKADRESAESPRDIAKQHRARVGLAKRNLRSASVLAAEIRIEGTDDNVREAIAIDVPVVQRPPGRDASLLRGHSPRSQRQSPRARPLPGRRCRIPRSSVHSRRSSLRWLRRSRCPSIRLWRSAQSPDDHRAGRHLDRCIGDNVVDEHGGSARRTTLDRARIIQARAIGGRT